MSAVAHRRGAAARRAHRGCVSRCVALAPALGLALALALASGHATCADVIAPRRLLEVVDIGPPVISPDGRRVAFRTGQASVERNAWDTVWYVQDMDGATGPRRVADGGVPLRDSAGVVVPVEAVWSPDGRYIHYLAAIDGRVDVWRAAADGSGAEAVTRDAADVRDFVLMAEGRELAYRIGATRAQVAAAEDAEYARGIRIDRHVPLGHNLFRSLDLGSGPATQRFQGPWFGLGPLLADTGPRWKVIDLDSDGPARELARPPAHLDPAGADPAYGHSWKMAVEPAGPRIALLERVGAFEGLREPIEVRLSVLRDRRDRRPRACTAPACVGKAISSVRWRPGTDEILFTVTDPDAGLAQSIHAWDVRTGGVRQVVQARGLINGGRDRSSTCGVSRGALACVAAEADVPPRLERIDAETGERHVLFAPNAVLAADIARASPARLLRWQDEAGRWFTGQLFEARTRDGTPAPLFVTYYTCPGFLRGGVGDEWPLASLAGHGISALCISSPPGYMLDPVERYGRGTAAVQAAVRMLAADGTIDPARVGMGGLSFGSEVTFWTLAQTGLLAAASVASPAIEPNYHLFATLRDDAFFESLDALWGLGAPDRTPAQWKTLSPVHHLDRIRAPVLFQMAEQEYLAALGVALPLVRRGQGDLYVFPHEAHQKFQPRHKLAVYERNLDWFRFWLTGEEDAEPDKEARYARWRHMRAALGARGPLSLVPDPVLDHAQVEDAHERRVPGR